MPCPTPLACMQTHTHTQNQYWDLPCAKELIYGDILSHTVLNSVSVYIAFYLGVSLGKPVSPIQYKSSVTGSFKIRQSYN